MLAEKVHINHIMFTRGSPHHYNCTTDCCVSGVCTIALSSMAVFVKYTVQTYINGFSLLLVNLKAGRAMSLPAEGPFHVVKEIIHWYLLILS